MKVPKHAWFVPLVLTGGLWFYTSLRAQESNALQNADSTSGATSNGAAVSAEAAEGKDKGHQGIDRGPLVSIGRDVELKAGDSAEAVVVIGASAKIHGKVRNAAVAVWGDLEVDGEVGDAAVAVMGDLKVGPGGKIHGEAVAVGGRVDAAETAKIGGQPVTVDFPTWLKKWFKQCVLKLRPLAPQVGWVWAVAGVYLLLYLFIAVVFPKPVEVCVAELTRRPASTFLFGLLIKLLVPVVLLILTATGIGLVVVPFVLVALLLAAIVGKAALLEYLGLQVGRQLGLGVLQKPILALVAGAVIIALFYMVPVLGLLVFMIVSVWGLGCAITAAAGGFRRELPEKPPADPPTSAWPAATLGPTQSEMTGASAGTAAASSPASATVAEPLAPPVLPEVLSHPRAGFWERMGAAFLDVVLVCLLGRLVGGPWWLLVALAYFTGLLTWKGTTIGGIVLGLKVVRLDGQPVTFAVALVRSLSAAFSVIVLFLGFLWIAWDKDKQGWHDKIAGTVVLRQPRGTPLVCI